jgi:hypothetical protein
MLVPRLGVATAAFAGGGSTICSSWACDPTHPSPQAIPIAATTALRMIPISAGKAARY